MLQQLITDNIDLWTSAETKRSTTGRGSNSKIELTGIKKLRELILELAVRGLLVPQNPKDDPASMLLEKIATEKAALIKAGNLKKQKPLPEITADDKPFDLPDGWEWIRLGDVAEFVNGFAFKSSDFTDVGIGIVKIGDIQNGEVTSASMSRVNEEVITNLDDSLMIKNGDMLIAMSGATTGKLGFNTSNEIYYINQRVGKISPYILSCSFLYHPLTTKIQENLSKSMGSAIPNLSTAQIKDIVFALPPLLEQHRIVAKVDELMALCDQLEQQQLQHSDTHHTLVTTLLDSLCQAADNKQFQTIWSQLATNFDILFTTDASIDQLKQTILQLAVMGKLVPQDPNDEPASVLLEKIAAEKAQLIKDGKIKKQKPLSAITDDEKLFKLPDGWEWARLQNLAEYIQRGKGPKYAEIGSVQVVSQKCIQWAGFDLSKARFVDEHSLDAYQEERFLKTHDLLWNSTGTGTVGRINVLPKTEGKLVADSHVTIIRPLFVNSQFICTYLTSPSIQLKIDPEHELSLVSGTTKQVELNTSTITPIATPLPPLAEQHRIVAKVDELMTLCDQLKVGLNQAQTTQQHLACAVVEQGVKL